MAESPYQWHAFGKTAPPRRHVTDAVLSRQGGIAGSAIFIIVIGASGLLTILLRFIGPITVCFCGVVLHL